MRGYISLEPSSHGHRWVQRSEFAAPFDAYREYLKRRGYTAAVVGDCLCGVAHFLHWLTRKRCGMADMDEATVARFLDRHLPRCRCAKQCLRTRTPVRHALSHWLRVLRAQGWIAPLPSATAELDAELSRFEGYLIEVCGLTTSTRSTLLRHVRRFLMNRFGTGRIEFTALTARDMRRFVERYGAHWQPISLRAIGVSLRSYFRFKALSGARVEALVAAIPRVARWRLAGLPQTLAPQEIERLLSAFDRTRPGGRRDYAMARCLADLGLRPVEVGRLRLEDIHWDEGMLHIHGKGRRVHVLPLPQKLGTALAQYLRHGRPHTSSRALFIPLHAPLDKPVTSGAVWAALHTASRRAGLQARFKGPRLLRHSVATHLVQHRASLKTIADLLRHRSLNTTTIYAKVDLPALARVALPWPGRRV